MDKKPTKELATLQDAATLVENYAIRTVGKEAAQQFSTHISIMAQKDERFKKAKPESVVAAMMACVHLDLMPNTPQQYAYLIPYESPRGSGKFDIQFQLGYKGLLEIADRTGKIKAIYAELVFEGDEFDVSLGTERQLIHKPDLDVDRTDYSKVTSAYMMAVLTNGEKLFEIMTRKQLDKIQQSAKASSTDAPWAKWATEMARKTVVKRGIKLLPSSGKDSRLQFATALDSWSEAGKLKFSNGEFIEGEGIDEVEVAAERKARIQAAVDKRKELDRPHTPSKVDNNAEVEGE